uniref:Uncharacterized protein n=1 Tax=Timema poppense TaxID=170557 RepID=A0A7R9DTE6_TIMPO|nr:unnamed protein product [Timema poppensis]
MMERSSLLTVGFHSPFTQMRTSTPVKKAGASVASTVSVEWRETPSPAPATKGEATSRTSSETTFPSGIP